MLIERFAYYYILTPSLIKNIDTKSSKLNKSKEMLSKIIAHNIVVMYAD